MKRRAILTILGCNLIAGILLTLNGFLTVRYAPWGRVAVDILRMPAADLATKYGDPTALMHRGVLIELWVFGSVIALLVGFAAGVFYRRADWRVSALSTVVLIVVAASPTTVVNALAACLYLIASWFAMKLVSLWLRPAPVVDVQAVGSTS